MSKKPKLEMADNDDDIIGCDYCVCAPAKEGKPLIFPDNIMDFCVVCGCKVQLRPNVPPGPKRICYGCAKAQMKDEDVTVMITPKTVAEIKEWIKKYLGQLKQ